MSSQLDSAVRQARGPRPGEEAIERAKLAVVPRAQQRAPRIPFAVLVGLILLGGMVGLLMFNTSLQKTSFVISDRQAKADRLHAQEQQLRLELDQLRDPQALAVQALDLGMRPPDAPAFLRLGSASTTGDAAASTCLNCFRATAPDAPKPPVLRPAPVILPNPSRANNRQDSGAPTVGEPSRPGTKKPDATKNRGN